MSDEGDEDLLEADYELMGKISDRPEWADVTPEPLLESLVPIVAIDFPPRYKDVFGLLQAMIRANETSSRALSISGEAIRLSSANYGAWDWHWRCWQACGCEPEPEIELMQEIAADNPKNYQLWNFRRRFALHRGAAHAYEEMDFSADCLRVDAKNYHAWNHRHAIMQAFNLWDTELELTALLLGDDPYNNSAWSQRHAAFSLALSSQAPGINVRDEAALATKYILRAPDSRASWNYLRSLCKFQPGAGAPWNGLKACADLCNQVLAGTPSCVPAWGLLVHVLQVQQQKAAMSHQHAVSAVAAGKIRCCCDKLCIIDPMRSAYWQQMAQAASVEAQ